MTPALAAPLFVASIALMLLASAAFARRLDHIGLRLGLPEALLGLLTALAADAPEISSAISALVQHEHAVAVGVVVGSNAFNLAAMLGVSAIVAGRVRARHETLELEAFVGLWLLAAMLAVATGGIAATAGAGLVAVVVLPYLALLAAGPRLTRRLPLGVAESRFVRRSFGERHRRERSLDSRREAVGIVAVLLLALGLIVAGSVGAVRAATDLARAWSVPDELVGVIVLAVLTSLPNAWTGIRFGLQRRGSALMSETLNSNSINVVAGLAVPAALGSLVTFSHLAVFDLAWLFAMTVAALVLFGKRGGAGRAAGVFLIVLYAAFAVVQVAASSAGAAVRGPPGAFSQSSRCCSGQSSARCSCSTSPRLRRSCSPSPCWPASPPRLDLAAPPSGDRRRVAFHAGREGRAPGADPATVCDGRAGEAQRGTVWIRAGPDVVPVEDVFAERHVPVRARRRERRVGKAFLRRIGEGEERGSWIAVIARPPADLDLLCVPRVAHDEVPRRRFGRLAREEADREVERPPPGIDRCRAAAIRRS
jgi:cation:H+ antiporter